MKILQHSTPVALWYDTILEAEATCKIILNPEVEAYLVFLLMRYTNKPEITRHIIASEFLNALPVLPAKRHVLLQEIGDKCLLFSGLFPRMVTKRLVKLSYYVELGQSAYAKISHDHHDIYSLLAHQFVPLMDVLQSFCQAKTALLPLEAYELWSQTGSQRALDILKQYTNCAESVVNLRYFGHNIGK